MAIQNRWRFFGVQCLLLWCCLAGAQDTPAPAALPQRVSASTSWGSGFMVAPGYLLTAHHVVKNSDDFLVGPTSGNRWVKAELAQIDARLDLALIKVGLDLPTLRLSPDAMVPPGLEVSVIGFPQPRVQGMGKKITQGIVNGYRSDAAQRVDTSLMQISAEVAQGNSGGPVFAPDGTVIGMVLRKLSTAPAIANNQDIPVNVNFALRSAVLVQFLERAGVSPEQAPLSLETVVRPYVLFKMHEASVLSVVGRSKTTAPKSNE